MRTAAAPGPDAPYRAVSRRVVPFLFVLFVLAHVDRGNIAYAKSQLGAAFRFTDAVYAMGVGVFYLGYALLEVPSNVMLTRVGPRRWIARILASWGAACMAMAFIVGARSFCACRFVLGLAEAGFMPGAILYLTFWFPSRLRARTSTVFLTSIPVAIIISGPLSGVCLDLDGRGGLAGWQWLFLLEGAPSVIAAIVVLRWLPDGPRHARWLSEDTRARIQADLAAEGAGQGGDDHSPWRLLRRARLWCLVVPYFLHITGSYGVGNWLPPIVKQLPCTAGLGNVALGSIAAAPYVLAGIAMLLVARSSDRRGERRWHVACSGFAASIGLALAAVCAGNQVAVLIGLTLACVGMFSVGGPFWSLAVERLGERDKSIGIACINALGCLGGFLGPNLVAWLGPAAGLGSLAASFALFAIWIASLRPTAAQTAIAGHGRIAPLTLPHVRADAG